MKVSNELFKYHKVINGKLFKIKSEPSKNGGLKMLSYTLNFERKKQDLVFSGKITRHLYFWKYDKPRFMIENGIIIKYNQIWLFSVYAIAVYIYSCNSSLINLVKLLTANKKLIKEVLKNVTTSSSAIWVGLLNHMPLRLICLKALRALKFCAFTPYLCALCILFGCLKISFQHKFVVHQKLTMWVVLPIWVP